MLGRFELLCRERRERVLTTGKALLMASALAGCSSVPDAVNPVEWYKSTTNLFSGREQPQLATPVPPQGEYPDMAKMPEHKEVAKGLVADRSRAQYADSVRREVAPTKPLARKTPLPAAAETQVATAAPVVQEALPAPVQAAAATRMASPNAKDPGPDAPPASVNMIPPAPADVPENVTVPGKARMKPVQEQYLKRLAESESQVVRPDLTASANGFAADDEPIHLVLPSSKRTVKGGGKGLAAPAPVAMPAASFQVAALDFGAGSTHLTAQDRQSVAEVARLYKQTGGVVRIVGYSTGYGLDSSFQRADTVARELTKRGVPAGKIMVGADGATGEAGAQVFLDVM